MKKKFCNRHMTINIAIKTSVLLLKQRVNGMSRMFVWHFVDSCLKPSLATVLSTAWPTIETCQSNYAGLHLDFIYTSINSDHEYDVLMTLRETLTSNLSIRTNPVVIRQNTGIGNGILHLFSAFFTQYWHKLLKPSIRCF